VRAEAGDAGGHKLRAGARERPSDSASEIAIGNAKWHGAVRH
jgi:hypothetical protein